LPANKKAPVLPARLREFDPFGYVPGRSREKGAKTEADAQ
jgi:hypothetical protein